MDFWPLKPRPSHLWVWLKAASALEEVSLSFLSEPNRMKKTNWNCCRYDSVFFLLLEGNSVELSSEWQNTVKLKCNKYWHCLKRPSVPFKWFSKSRIHHEIEVWRKQAKLKIFNSWTQIEQNKTLISLKLGKREGGNWRTWVTENDPSFYLLNPLNPCWVTVLLEPNSATAGRRQGTPWPGH